MIYYTKENRKTDIIDKRDTMYPSYAIMTNVAYSVEAKEIGWATIFGFNFGVGSYIMVGDIQYNLKANQYFSIPVNNKSVSFFPYGEKDIFGVFRLGFLGHEVIGTQDINAQGKLSYIDGCSDSLLVYPPRLGDASISYLHFPSNINQSYHTHPSIRIGCVISGSGTSDTDKPIPLEEGTFFCLNEHELHRFRTDETSTMKIIAFHPDGDWGPTDENHTMFNRTYVKK